jgi:pimeloyl-ACP methyl ester carboxylesterase
MRWLAVLISLCAFGQEPPVVLLNGYQLECPPVSISSLTFGLLESLLKAEGRKVLFFDNCTVQGSDGRPTIEEIAQAFGKFLDQAGAPQFDVVGHSMGGLIVRSYLAGQLPQGGFNPPSNPRIRKAVFIATPHYGALAVSGFLVPANPDKQAVQLLQGSSYLWDLATWNQGTADLRDVDAISIAGSGGISRPVPQSHDGAVPITSASFANVIGTARVRVVPYCHTSGLPTFLCQGRAISEVDAADHLSWRIIRSFLAGTSEWRSVGVAPGDLTSLGKYSGAVAQYRNADNTKASDVSITFTTTGTSGMLLENSNSAYFADLLPSGAYKFQAGGQTFNAELKPGQYGPLLLKPGPVIAHVGSAAAALPTLSRAPGMLVSIFGTDLDSAAVEINAVRATPVYNDAKQINVVIPEALAGLIRVKVTNTKGSAESQVLLESAVPAVFTLDGSGIGVALSVHEDGSLISAASPARAGEIVSV